MKRTSATLLRLLPVLLVLFSFQSAAPASDADHQDLAVGYQVDPDWPQRSDDIPWKGVPGVAVDDHDHVWMFTRCNPPVQVYDGPTGQLIRSWGDEHVANAHHIKIDHEGHVWLADFGNHTVMKFTAEGQLLLTLGTNGVAGCDETHLDKPTDMAIDPASGDIFVSDGYGNRRMVHFNAQGQFVKTWGHEGTAPGEFMLPHSIAMDAQGRLYVGDRSNARIQIFDQTGKFLSEWRNRIVPWGFCFTKENDLWVCGSSPMRWAETENGFGAPPKDQLFMRFRTDGRFVQLWTIPKCEQGEEVPGATAWLHGIATDSKGNLYVGDVQGNRLQKFVRLD